MSTNYSKIYVKCGTMEITIEGESEFVSGQFQEIFNLQGDQTTLTDEAKQSAKGKHNELPEPQKLEHPVSEKTNDQTQKAKTTKSSNESTKLTQSTKTAGSNKILNTLGSDFKKWLANLPNSAETRDKILIAAYYNQTMNSEKKFYVRGIRATLKEHGISVSNLSNFLDTFEIQKIISKVSDSSRKGYQFTNEGEKYIQSLFSV